MYGQLVSYKGGKRFISIIFQYYVSIISQRKNISLMGPMYYGKEWTPLVTELTYSDTLKVTPLTLGDT